MSSHRTTANRPPLGPTTMTSQDKLRCEWRDFQVWNAAMKIEEEMRFQREIQELTLAMERRLATQRWRSDTSPTIRGDFKRERSVLQNKMEEQVSFRAREEWHARLKRTGLSMDEWTDITSAENAAVAAVEWGAPKELHFDADDSSDDAESTISSQSKTPTPSIISSRGPQLWTPPETARTAELPRATAQVPLPSFGQHAAENTPVTLRARFPRPELSVHDATGAQVAGFPGMVSPPIDTPIQLPTPRARHSTIKADEYVTAPSSTSNAGTYEARSSWSDDGTTLLAASRNTTEDESNHHEKDSKAPAYQKIPVYTQWIPPRTDEPTLRNPRPNVPTRPRSRTMSSLSSQSIPMNRPNISSSTLQDSIEPSLQWKDARWKQIEKDFQPMLIEARGVFQDQVRDAPRDFAEWTKGFETSKANIQRIAHDLYRDATEQERQRLRRLREDVASAPGLPAPKQVVSPPVSVEKRASVTDSHTHVMPAPKTVAPVASPPKTILPPPASSEARVSTTNAPLTSASAEWARRQEEQARKQQEAFRREQDAIRLKQDALRLEQEQQEIKKRAQTTKPLARKEAPQAKVPPRSTSPTASNTSSTRSNASTEPPAAHRMPIPNPDAEPSEEWKQALRKQVEENLLPMVKEAKEALSRGLSDPSISQVTRDRLGDEHSDRLKNIRRIADDLYRDHIDQERQQLRWTQGGTVDLGWSEGILKQQQAIIDKIARTRQEQEGRETAKQAHVAEVPAKAAVSQPKTAAPASGRPSSPLSTPSHTQVRLTEPATAQRAPNADAEPDDAWKMALRKCIEESLLPTLTEARESFGKKFAEAPHNRAEWNNELDTTENELRRMADDLYRDEIEAERQRLRGAQTATGTGTSEDSKAQQQRILAQIEKDIREREKVATKPSSHTPRDVNKRADQPDRSSVAKPPSPLTPPQTPKYGARYIGPVMSQPAPDEDPKLTAGDLKLTEGERKQEVLRFEKISLDIRKQKIREFHDIAMAKENELAERWFKERPGRAEGQMILARYEQDMEELRKTKERERREATAEERKKRVAQLSARLQKPSEQEEVRLVGGMGRRSGSSGPSKETTASAAANAPRGPNDLGTAMGMSRNAGMKRTPNFQDPTPTAPKTSNRPAAEAPPGSSGLLFQNFGPRGADAIATNFVPSSFNKNTPTSPVSRLPQMYSDDEDGNHSFTSFSDVEDRRHVRFTSSDISEDSDSEDGEPNINPRRRPRRNTVTNSNHLAPRRSGGGKGATKPAVGGQVVPEIWHPPVSSGKEQQGVPAQPSYENWRGWRG